MKMNITCNQRMIKALIIVGVYIGLLFGCQQEVHVPQEKQIRNETHSYEGISLPPTGDPNMFFCRECLETEAEAILIVEFIIPEVKLPKKYAIPFRREFVYNVLGELRQKRVIPPSSHRHILRLVDGEESKLTLSINHPWSTKDGKIKEFRMVLPLILGSREEVYLYDEGIILRVLQEEPNKSKKTNKRK